MRYLVRKEETIVRVWEREVEADGEDAAAEEFNKWFYDADGCLEEPASEHVIDGAWSVEPAGE